MLFNATFPTKQYHFFFATLIESPQIFERTKKNHAVEKKKKDILDQKIPSPLPHVRIFSNKQRQHQEFKIL